MKKPSIQSKGGMAVLKKCGKRYFRELGKKGAAARAAKAKPRKRT